MFGLGVPSEFSVELLAEEQRRVQCPVLVITGTEHDTWRDLTPAQEAERVGWLRARHVTSPTQVTTCTSKIPTKLSLRFALSSMRSTMTVVVLHDLGDPTGRTLAIGRAAPLIIPDLPGHGSTPASRTATTTR